MRARYQRLHSRPALVQRAAGSWGRVAQLWLNGYVIEYAVQRMARPVCKGFLTSQSDQSTSTYPVSKHCPFSYLSPDKPARAWATSMRARQLKELTLYFDVVARGSGPKENAEMSVRSMTSARRDTASLLADLTLLWHFGSMLRKSTVAVGTTIMGRWRSEQLGDDGATDFRQRGLWRRPVGVQLFPPDPQPSGAGVADRQKQCRSSAHADADRSRTGPRSRQDRVPV